MSKAADLVVFQNLRDAVCSECGAELPRHGFLFMEAEKPLCLSCARLKDLEYLPAGDAALTRRAGKYSKRTAVVVRFSRSRKRYERQGVLVEVAALERAEQECLADAEDRARTRVIAARRREDDDRVLVTKMVERIQALFPGCPANEVKAIATHTAARGSGRVGRTAEGRNLDQRALAAAVAAAIRHRHTNYDELLARGVERDAARERVAARVRNVLESWKNPLSP